MTTTEFLNQALDINEHIDRKREHSCACVISAKSEIWEMPNSRRTDRANKNMILIINT